MKKTFCMLAVIVAIASLFAFYSGAQTCGSLDNPCPTGDFSRFDYLNGDYGSLSPENWKELDIEKIPTSKIPNLPPELVALRMTSFSVEQKKILTSPQLENSFKSASFPITDLREFSLENVREGLKNAFGAILKGDLNGGVSLLAGTIKSVFGLQGQLSLGNKAGAEFEVLQDGRIVLLSKSVYLGMLEKDDAVLIREGEIEAQNGKFISVKNLEYRKGVYTIEKGESALIGGKTIRADREALYIFFDGPGYDSISGIMDAQQRINAVLKKTGGKFTPEANALVSEREGLRGTLKGAVESEKEVSLSMIRAYNQNPLRDSFAVLGQSVVGNGPYWLTIGDEVSINTKRFLNPVENPSPFIGNTFTNDGRTFGIVEKNEEKEKSTMEVKGDGGATVTVTHNNANPDEAEQNPERENPKEFCKKLGCGLQAKNKMIVNDQVLQTADEKCNKFPALCDRIQYSISSALEQLGLVPEVNTKTVQSMLKIESFSLIPNSELEKIQNDRQRPIFSLCSKGNCGLGQIRETTYDEVFGNQKYSDAYYRVFGGKVPTYNEYVNLPAEEASFIMALVYLNRNEAAFNVMPSGKADIIADNYDTKVSPSAQALLEAAAYNIGPYSKESTQRMLLVTADLLTKGNGCVTQQDIINGVRESFGMGSYKYRNFLYTSTYSLSVSNAVKSSFGDSCAK